MGSLLYVQFGYLRSGSHIIRADQARYVKRTQLARVTLPERRHLVHTWICAGVPSTIAFTRLTLGFHALLER